MSDWASTIVGVAAATQTPQGPYWYENLGEDDFQHLCAALVAAKYDNVTVYPVGQSDGGRDIKRKTTDGDLIYQVKWSKNAITNPVSWLTSAIKKETDKIKRLVARGATRYILITSVAGTSPMAKHAGRPGSGTMDKLDEELAGYAEQLGLEAMECWWRDDVDALVVNADSQTCWSAATNVSTPSCSTVPAGATSYTYDARGNRTGATTGGTTTAYSWDQANNLLGYGTNTTYSYDGDGLRTQRVSSGTTTNYTWQTNADGLPMMLSDGTYDYLYGPDHLPFEQITGTTDSYLHHDQAGSTRAITNQAGAVTGTYNYDPYGEATHAGTATTTLQWDGEYTDTASGLIYLRARYYDPTTGEFISKDPLAAETGAPYAYGRDDPLDTTDPLGLWTLNPISDVEQAGSTLGHGLSGAGGKFASAASRAAGGLSTAYTWSVMNLDPAYFAIDGYYNEWQAATQGCSEWTVAEYGAEGVAGVAATAGVGVGAVEAAARAGYTTGREISIGKNFRISPLGNRNADALAARAPHYHRRIADGSGNTVAGGGMKWHRPWQKGF